MRLLSIGSDSKTIKGEKYGYSTAIQFLAPYNLSSHQVCPMAAKAKCHIGCLNTAGHGRFNTVQQARINRTKFFFENTVAFIDQLKSEIEAHVKKSKKNNVIPCVRLNGTSDIRWENHGIIQSFPNVQFYDYTKLTNRKNIPSNYHLTYSYSPVYPKQPQQYNWAVVFRNELPKEYLEREVINGDENDLRFLDKTGVVVGLKAKGLAKRDNSGFVVDV